MMKVFVWNYVSRLTDNYHDGGGLVICASSLEDARSAWQQQACSETKNCTMMTVEPDHVVECDPDSAPFISIHQDAGCC